MLLLLTALTRVGAQDTFNQMDESGNITQRSTNQNFNKHNNDTTRNKEVPKGHYVWTVDRKFGDIMPATPDTMHHLYMNTTLNTGLYGEYNTTGNNYTARQNRIFIDRRESSSFIFTDPYSYFFKQPDEFHFTNTLSPYTRIDYDNCGDNQFGEDRIDAKFAVNANKRLWAAASTSTMPTPAATSATRARPTSTPHSSPPTSATTTRCTSSSRPTTRRRLRTAASPTTTTSPTPSRHLRPFLRQRDSHRALAELEPQRQPARLPLPPLQHRILPQGADDGGGTESQKVCRRVEEGEGRERTPEGKDALRRRRAPKGRPGGPPMRIMGSRRRQTHRRRPPTPPASRSTTGDASTSCWLRR